MRPIMLSGHERSLTQIKYNAEGDLLFSASKDHVINVWHSHNGERLGTYNGHNGTVWTIDADGKLSNKGRRSRQMGRLGYWTEEMGDNQTTQLDWNTSLGLNRFSAKPGSVPTLTNLNQPTTNERPSIHTPPLLAASC